MLLLFFLKASSALAQPGPPANFQARIRANDAPMAGRLTITAYFLDTLDDSLKAIRANVPRDSLQSPMGLDDAGRWLLLRFHDSNGKNAFVVPTDLAISGNHRSAYRMDLIPVGRKRVGGNLEKAETRWALCWVPQGPRQMLDWDAPGDLQLQYGFNKTPFVPLSEKERAKVVTLMPWAALKSACLDSTGDHNAVDAAAFDQPPVPKVRRDPPYPSSAKMYDFHGSLFVAAHVNPAGKVEDAYVLQSDAVHDLNVAALAAVMEWTFKPGMKSGKPVAGDIVIPVKFDLGSVK